MGVVSLDMGDVPTCRPDGKRGMINNKLMSILLATVQASAKAAEINGGMSIISSEFVSALLTGIAGIVSTSLVYFKMKAKCDKVTVKRPLDHEDVFVTHGECKEHRCALNRRIDEVGPALNRLFVKMKEMDKKSEDRAVKLHERLEPIVAKVAANAAQVDILVKERFGNDEKRSA